MVYLMNNIGQVDSYKDHQEKTIKSLISSGRWVRINDRKDKTPYAEPKVVKKATKKVTKKKK